MTSDNPPAPLTAHSAAAGPVPVRRLHRRERREQILAAATRAFAHHGFAGTDLDTIAAAASISRVLLYRHFESKAELYRAVLERARSRLVAAVGVGGYTPESVEALIGAAAEDPAGFRLLFQHAAREPEFRQQMDAFQATMVTSARRQLSQIIADPSWAKWAAHLAPVVAAEAIIAWLDIGQPDREQVADRVREVLAGIVRAAQHQ